MNRKNKLPKPTLNHQGFDVRPTNQKGKLRFSIWKGKKHVSYAKDIEEAVQMIDIEIEGIVSVRKKEAQYQERERKRINKEHKKNNPPPWAGVKVDMTPVNQRRK